MGHCTNLEIIVPRHQIGVLHRQIDPDGSWKFIIDNPDGPSLISHR